MAKVKRLNFREEYKDKILSGKKRATIRLGKVSKYEVGDLVDIYAGDKKISSAIISKVRYLKFKDLKREDVRKDGFKSKAELKRALKKIYKKEFKTNSYLTQIEFIIED